ncbi:AlbA family DNA-binding domain-containing protein [Marinoscillum furvescens]|uniref:Putative DNA-binding protein n=1 Tax=Marinoscillum furvescens DSM 4134 TaxID=1122208 RepID=A0A3D9KYL5_MARFU|nr:ATP-binding protein [Marinoscillum furvescens]RED91329.1 putative DNA-binding protein [Marinoscillum furvescens DSM 4134]
MTIEKFQELIESSEGKTLDFKTEFYDFDTDSDVKKKNYVSEFIKDILSIYNTQREGNGYLIFGVLEKNGKAIDLVGVSNLPDDAVLQDKLKDKVKPVPDFILHQVEFEGKKFGIIEIYLPSFNSPSMAIRDFGNIKKDEVYIRKGSTKAKATPEETKRVYEWLEELEHTRKRKVENKDQLIEFIDESLKDDSVFDLANSMIFERGREIGLTDDEVQILIIQRTKIKNALFEIDVRVFVILLGIGLLVAVYFIVAAVLENNTSNKFREKVELLLSKNKSQQARDSLMLMATEIDNFSEIKKLIIEHEIDDYLHNNDFKNAIKSLNWHSLPNVKTSFAQSSSTNSKEAIVRGYNQEANWRNTNATRIFNEISLSDSAELGDYIIDFIIAPTAFYQGDSLVLDSTRIRKMRELIK